MGGAAWLRKRGGDLRSCFGLRIGIAGMDCAWSRLPPWVCVRCKLPPPGSIARANNRPKLRRNCKGPVRSANRLLNAIDDLVSNGEASRSAEDIGRCLAICQNCEAFHGDWCAEEIACPKAARKIFLKRLTRRGPGCDKWGDL